MIGYDTLMLCYCEDMKYKITEQLLISTGEKLSFRSPSLKSSFRFSTLTFFESTTFQPLEIQKPPKLPPKKALLPKILLPIDCHCHTFPLPTINVDVCCLPVNAKCWKWVLTTFSQCFRARRTFHCPWLHTTGAKVPAIFQTPTPSLCSPYHGAYADIPFLLNFWSFWSRALRPFFSGHFWGPDWRGFCIITVRRFPERFFVFVSSWFWFSDLENL